MINISKEILTTLGESVVKYWAGDKSKQFKYQHLNGLKSKIADSGVACRDVDNAFQYLRRRKYISIKIIDKKKNVVLTAKGAAQYAKYCNLCGEKRRDNKLTLVCFEIPEQKRELRDFVRRRLQENGFILTGRGVYLSTNKINNNFKFMVHLYGLEKFIMWGEYKSEHSLQS